MKRKQNCAICKKFGYVDSHHIVSKSKGGSNKSFNKVQICPNCHRSVHLGDIVIEGKFMTAKGIELIYHFKEHKSLTSQEPAVHIFGRPGEI